MICLFESSTCFEQPCAHPQEDNCINTIVLLRTSTGLLETCRGFKYTYHRRNCASGWLPTRISQTDFREIFV